jgi:hypothetical protein
VLHRLGKFLKLDNISEIKDDILNKIIVSPRELAILLVENNIKWGLA